MLSETIITTTVKALATKLIDTGVGAIKKRSNGILLALKNDKILNLYTQNAVNRVFVFRTLIHGDRNVYLDEVYHPLKLSESNKLDHIKVTNNTRLPDHTPICIIGIAGQGKTTVMRKLFLEELVAQKTLPFFISLRQIKNYDNLSCEELLLNHLRSNGIPCSMEDVTYLCESKKISFYFDGFDEIPFNQRNPALETINTIHDKYRCPVTVTTRPETEITHSAGYKTYHVNFLEKHDILSILKKTVSDNDAREFLLRLLETKEFLMQSIKTPILLDIFIITSTALREDPNSISDYYDGLFSALLHRHDLIKNLTRIKKSNLTDRILEKCFSLFSFFSLMNSKGDFTRAEINELFAKSASALKIESLPEHIADDIIDGTNILVKDGYDNYVYIHKSIQEYFAAKCISNMDDSAKENIYKNFCKMGSYQLGTSFMMMISFLDSFSFTKLFILEKLATTNSLKDNTIIRLQKEDYFKNIESWILEIDPDGQDCHSLTTKNVGPWDQMDVVEQLATYISARRFRQSLEIIGDNIMLRNGREIASSVSEGMITPLKMDDPRLEGHQADNENSVLIDIGSAKACIKDYHDILEKSYSAYAESETILSEYIKLNYHDKIESSNILNSMIDNINFK